MKQGKTLIELCKELERQRMARKDFIADTRSLMITTNEHGQSQLDVDLGNTNQIFNVNDLAHQQIASRLQIPLKYYQKMRLEYPSLLDENINSWFSKNGERRMLRTLDTNIRAFLSDRYRRLDLSLIHI